MSENKASNFNFLQLELWNFHFCRGEFQLLENQCLLDSKLRRNINLMMCITEIKEDFYCFSMKIVNKVRKLLS